MVGDPQCARVLGPFRQAPAQQGGRDNHAAPDPMHRDGGMRRDRRGADGTVTDKDVGKVEDGARREEERKSERERQPR